MKGITVKQLFKIDESVYNSNDDRTTLLIEKGIGHQDFLRLIDATDPFVVKNGTLYFVPKEKSEEAVSKFIEQRKKYLEKFGDISPAALLKHEDIMINVYPELTEVYAEVKAKNESENCSSCSANRHAEKILKALVDLPYKDRDLSSLVFIGKLGLKVLKKETIEVDESRIEAPLHIAKVYREEEKAVETKTDAHPMQCLFCAMEHMGKAAENYREYLKGYDGINHRPNHLPLAFGNIAEAECQTVVSWPVLADEIRKLKLEMRENLRIPCDEMLDKICEVFWLVLEEYDPAGDQKHNCGCKGK